MVGLRKIRYALGGDVQHHSPTSLTPALDQLPDIDHHNRHGPCCDHRKRIPLFFGSGPTKAAKRCIKDRRVASRLASGRSAKSKKCSRTGRCKLFPAATFLFFSFFSLPVCFRPWPLPRLSIPSHLHAFTTRPLRSDSVWLSSTGTCTHQHAVPPLQRSEQNRADTVAE